MSIVNLWLIAKLFELGLGIGFGFLLDGLAFRCQLLQLGPPGQYPKPVLFIENLC